MKPPSLLKSTFKGCEDYDEGKDGFRCLYWTQRICYAVQISWGLGWEHASISVLSPKRRIPNWEEMCMFKNLIWQDDECVMQLHPPKQNYVNNCKYVLHLWRPIDKEIPQPPKIFV